MDLYKETQTRHEEKSETFKWPFNPYFGIVIFIILFGGYFGSRHFSSCVHGEPFNGTFTNEEYKYSFYLPESWFIVKDPVNATHFSDAIGYFFKGSSRKPDIQMFINYSVGDSNAPKYFSGDQLDAMEPRLKRIVGDIKRKMGLQYEFLRLSTYTINKRDAFWIEGNVTEGNKPAKRDFTFLTFEGSRMYVIGFNMDESKTDAFWPEIQTILASMTFYY